MRTIGEKQVEMVKTHVEALFRDYLSDIDDAYMESENEITLSFTAKIFPHPTMPNETKVKTKLRFTPKATTDEIEGTCSELQPKLNFHETPEYETGTEPGKVRQIKDDDDMTDGDPAAAPETGPETGERLQPNEHGVIVVDPMFTYESKKATAGIHLAEYNGRWYQAWRYDARNAGGAGGLPSIYGAAYTTAEDALDAAKQGLIGQLESVIVSHPDKRSAIKKVIIWAEGLIIRPSHAIQTAAPETKNDLDLQIEFLAERMKSPHVDLEQAKDWFIEVAGKVIAETFPRFTYIKPEEIIDWIDSIPVRPLIEELERVMASSQSYRDAIFEYIEVHDLQPHDDADDAGGAQGEAEAGAAA